MIFWLDILYYKHLIKINQDVLYKSFYLEVISIFCEQLPCLKAKTAQYLNHWEWLLFFACRTGNFFVRFLSSMAWELLPWCLNFSMLPVFFARLDAKGHHVCLNLTAGISHKTMYNRYKRRENDSPLLLPNSQGGARLFFLFSALFYFQKLYRCKSSING